MNLEPDLHAQTGDSFRAALQVMDVDGRGVARGRDVTGATFTATIRRGPTRQADLSGGNFAVAVTDAAEGLVELTLPSNHLLRPGTHWYEVDMRTGPAVKETVLKGRLIVQEGLING